MPFRRNPRLLRKLERRYKENTGSSLDAQKYMMLMELILERVYALLIWLGVLCLMLFVVLIGLQLQVQRRNRLIDHLDRSAKQTQIASERAQNAAETTDRNLQTALAAGAAQGQASADAIQAIHRIELRLCGGPCPVPPSATTTTTTIPTRP